MHEISPGFATKLRIYFTSEVKRPLFLAAATLLAAVALAAEPTGPAGVADPAHSKPPSIDEASKLSAPPAPAPPVVVTIAAVGDIRLDGPVGAVADKYGPGAPVAAVKKDLEADILFGNLETPVTSKGTKTSKKWNFRAHPRYLSIVRAAGFDVLNLANNHVWDYGREGFVDTLHNLKGGPWTIIGAGKDRDDAEKVRVVEKKGLKIGFVGLTSTHPDEAWATPKKPGVAYSDYDRVPGIVKRAKEKCDLLVVSFHGGTELAENPNEIQLAVAHRAITAGADLFLGHHPHVLQPLELQEGKPIVHSLGNFLFVSPSTGTWHSAIARVALTKEGVSSIEFVPVEIDGGAVKPAGPEATAAVREKLDRGGALSGDPGAFSVRGAAK